VVGSAAGAGTRKLAGLRRRYGPGRPADANVHGLLWAAPCRFSRPDCALRG